MIEQMPARFSDAGRSLFARKGIMFLVNHLVLAPLALYLLLQLALLEGVSNKRNLVVRFLALGCVAIFGYLSLVLGRRGNARLLPCFVAVCLAAELLMRAIGSFGVGHEILSRTPQPYFMFSGAPNGRLGTGDSQIRFNGDGFRIEGEITADKPADEIRIFVMGGSTVLFGTPIANTIPGALEASLRAERLPQARVYNLGVQAFVSSQELSLLVHRLVYLKPDLVVAYDGGNDLIFPWIYDPRPGYPFNFLVWEEAINKLSNTGNRSKSVAGLAQDSVLLQALVGTTEWDIRADRESLRQKAGFPSEPWKRAIVDAYAQNIAAMCRIARTDGVLFAAYFQPMLPYSKQTLDQRQLQMSGGTEIVEGVREERRLVPAAVAAQMNPAEAGCRFSDVSSLFENESATFTDVIHVKDEANRVIARRIADELLSWDALQTQAQSQR
jgi:lysophospholipase L1-like esterase